MVTALSARRCPAIPRSCPNSLLAKPTSSHLKPRRNHPGPLVHRWRSFADILAELRTAEHLPWPDLTLAMAAEQHVPRLARIAGAEGRSLAATIMDETERLFAADEQAAVRAYAPAGSGP